MKRVQILTQMEHRDSSIDQDFSGQNSTIYTT